MASKVSVTSKAHLVPLSLTTYSAPVSEMATPKKMGREEKIKLAKELHRQGFSLGQIAKILGVSKSTVKNYLDDYPYKKK